MTHGRRTHPHSHRRARAHPPTRRGRGPPRPPPAQPRSPAASQQARHRARPLRPAERDAGRAGAQAERRRTPDAALLERLARRPPDPEPSAADEDREDRRRRPGAQRRVLDRPRPPDAAVADAPPRPHRRRRRQLLGRHGRDRASLRTARHGDRDGRQPRPQGRRAADGLAAVRRLRLRLHARRGRRHGALRQHARGPRAGAGVEPQGGRRDGALHLRPGPRADEVGEAPGPHAADRVRLLDARHPPPQAQHVRARRPGDAVPRQRAAGGRGRGAAPLAVGPGCAGRGHGADLGALLARLGDESLRHRAGLRRPDADDEIAVGPAPQVGRGHDPPAAPRGSGRRPSIRGECS